MKHRAMGNDPVVTERHGAVGSVQSKKAFGRFHISLVRGLGPSLGFRA